MGRHHELAALLDEVGVLEPGHDLGEHHDLLLANLFAQTEALAFGKTAAEARRGSARAPGGAPDVPGNRPSSTILLPHLSPYTVGQLVALYEHKVFTQGWIWGINSFDQWGVELGKALATRIAGELADPHATLDHDSSTSTLIARYRRARRERE